MNESTFALILTAVAVIGGYAAGIAPEPKTRRKRLGVTGLVLLLIAGLAAGMVCCGQFTVNMVKMLSVNLFKYPDPSDMDLGILIRTSFISDGNWSGLAGVVVFALLCGWFAFLCARTATRRASLIAVAAAGPLWVTGLLFGVSGCLVWLILLRQFSFLCPTSWPIIVTLTAAVLGLLIWTVYLQRRQRRGWRVLLVALGLLIGINYLCWALATLSAVGYTAWVRAEAVKQGVKITAQEYNPQEQIVKQWEQTDKNFRHQHPLFQLPWDNIHIWVKRPDVAAKDMVTPEEREYTLKFFDTPEARQFYQTYRDYADSRPRGFVEVWQLDAVRGYIRFCCGRAALFGESGQTDKILPELVKAMMVDRQMLDGQPIFFGELVRIACRFVWCGAMVSLGPDDAKSAAVYRQALDYLKGCKIHFSGESDYYSALLQRGDSEKLSVFWPARTMYNARGLSYALSIVVKMKDFEKNGYNGEPLPWAASDYLQTALTKSQASITVCTTAMALKLYRSLEGKYPAALTELVPKYLDRVPESPFAGHPLNYDTDGKDFTLTLTAPNGSKFKMTSQKEY